MKKKKMFVLLTFILILVFSTQVYAANVRISLNKTKASVTAGSSVTLKAKVSGTSSKVSWSSSNSKVATVKNGKVTGIKAGTAKITAKAGGKRAVCTVTVKANPANAYRNLIKQYEKKYGKAQTGYAGSVFYWRGLCFAKMLDFNGDGVKELVLAYQTGRASSSVKYHVELWSFNGKKANRIASGISWSGNNGPVFGGFMITKYNGRYLLKLTNGNKEYYYGRKSNGKLGRVHAFVWKGDAMAGKWYYNGKAVSVGKYQQYTRALSGNGTWYSFSNSRNSRTIQSEISKTKKSLNYK